MRPCMTVEALENRQLLSASLVADASGFFPTDAVTLNGVSYFTADDGVHGSEIWKSDGTQSGTVMVKDITPGTDGSTIYDIHAIGQQILFFTIDNKGRRFIWHSDGTAGGTYSLAEISPDSANMQQPSAIVNGRLVFTTAGFPNDSTHQGRVYRLWSSDGTVAGTTVIRTLTMGDAVNKIFQLDHHAVFFFGSKVWSTDGTAAGTFTLAPPGGVPWQHLWQPQPESPRPQESPTDKLLFWGDGKLWRTDGTLEGTQFVSDYAGLRPVRLNDKMLYEYYNGTDRWLVASDGTTEGTQLIKRADPNGGLNPITGANVGNKRFFLVGEPVVIEGETTRFSLWSTDGTAEGTAKITTFDPTFFWVDHFVGVQGHFFFLALDSARELQLWQSDGTEAGTSLLKTLPNAPATDLKVVEDQLAVVEGRHIQFLYSPLNAVVSQPIETAVSLNQGVLNILGTSASDTITVCRNSRDASRLLITINGVRWKFLTSKVKSIVIHGYAGNDRITIDETYGTLTASTRIWGGSGNDVIRTGCGRDTVDGEAGNDNIISGNNNDVDTGGLGNDSINAGYGDDVVNGDEGVDSVIGGRGTDMICGGQDGSSDHLDGGGGADVIFGHAVYDIFFAGKQDTDPLDDVLLS